MGGGTYSTKQGFPAELPPSATLLRIANIVGVEFELEQVICDTFDSYILINPFPVNLRPPRPHRWRSRPSAPAGAHNDVTWSDSRIPWIRRQFPPLMTIQDSCIMGVYSQHEAADEPLPAAASLENGHESAVRDVLDYEAAEGWVDDSGSNAY